MYRTRATAICVFEILQSSTIRCIMVPYGQFEQNGAERKLYLVIPIFSEMRLYQRAKCQLRTIQGARRTPAQAWNWELTPKYFSPSAT